MVTTENRKSTILINGVSIASLCLAMGVKQEEIDVTLIDARENSDEVVPSNSLVILYPASQNTLKKLDIWYGLEEFVEPFTGVHYFDGESPEYLHSIDLEHDVTMPVAIPHDKLYNALIEQLGQFGIAIERETKLIDHKNKKEHNLVTLEVNEQKEIFEAGYFINATEELQDGDINPMNLKTTMHYRSAIITKESIKENKEANEALKLQNISENVGDINMLVHDRKSLQIVQYKDSVHLTLATNEILEEGTAQQQLDTLLAIAGNRLGKTFPETKIMREDSYTYRSTKSLQQHGMFIIGEGGNQYMGEHQGINQSIADIDNLLWKIILTKDNEQSRDILYSYNDERLVSHKGDHENNFILRKTLYMEQGVAKYFSSLKRRFSNKKFQTIARYEFVGTYDQYPESKRCVEEYPSMMQMAPRNKSTDVTRSDGLSFFRGPKAGFQAPPGYLVFESNEPKQNRKELLTNTRHILLIFDGTESDNSEEVTKLLGELQNKYDDFLDCYRITTSYEIEKHDKDVTVFGDSEAEFHKQYNATKSCYYLIRPDGVIAFRSLGLLTDKLEHHIEIILGNKTFD